MSPETQDWSFWFNVHEELTMFFMIRIESISECSSDLKGADESLMGWLVSMESK